MVGAGPHSPGQGVPSAHPQGWLCLSPSCSHALFGKGNKVGGGGGAQGVSWECRIPDFQNTIGERGLAPVLVRVDGVKQQSCFPGCLTVLLSVQGHSEGG